jgi:hypothetical protein
LKRKRVPEPLEINLAGLSADFSKVGGYVRKSVTRKGDCVKDKLLSLLNCFDPNDAVYPEFRMCNREDQKA